MGNFVIVKDTGETIRDAVIKNCDQCLKKTAHKTQVIEVGGFIKGRFYSET